MENNPIFIDVKVKFLESNKSENFTAAIGQYDGESNDDQIFYWFDGSESIIGKHNDDFEVLSFSVGSKTIKSVEEEQSYFDSLKLKTQIENGELKNIAVQFQDELVMLYTPSIERAREAMLHAFADGKIDEPQDIYEIPDSDMQFHSFDGHVWDAGKELDWSKVQISSIASRASENKTLRDALAALNSKNQNLQIK
ncbi:MAG: hypothetical protein M1300_04050 [Epsilonproteobacteria bacterium]|nr:hypothetical protein [Campylobacterota bacterium]